MTPNAEVVGGGGGAVRGKELGGYQRLLEARGESEMPGEVREELFKLSC